MCWVGPCWTDNWESPVGIGPFVLEGEGLGWVPEQRNQEEISRTDARGKHLRMQKTQKHGYGAKRVDPTEGEIA